MATSTPDISILIITYNRPEDTLALLESIRLQDELSGYLGEILILNNASSTDYQSVRQFISNHPGIPIRFLNSEKNLGVAGGRNFLIQQSSFPYLLFLDDDVVFDQDNAIQLIANLFNLDYFSRNNTAVITLNIHYFENGKRQPNALPHKRYQQYKDKAHFLTSYFIGAAHLMKKEIFGKTGLYPEDFFYGMEEYDLSYRIIQSGYTIGYDSQVKILHKESPQGRVPPREKLQMMWYNKCVVAYRYLPKRYFYSTAVMWSLQYLRKSGWDIPGMIKTWNSVRKIPSRIQRRKLDKQALSYLKSVKSRLWY